jgi:CubicO group peptidase (beta-lactamase class C family)
MPTSPTSRFRFLALAALLALASASAQPVPLDSLARAAAEADGLPSLVVGVVAGGERHVVGVGTVGGAAPDAHTPYEIGSVSKVLTALALADAVTDGEVELTTPVADLLPDTLEVAASAAGPYRLVDLATHTSGLPRLPGDLFTAPGFAMANPYTHYGADRLLAFLERAEVETAPGETYGYSNLGAGLLGYALARRDGAGYAERVRRRVLAPLGLDATTLDAPEGLAPAHGADGAPVPPWTWTDATAGAGGWRSTASDLLTLAEAALAPSASALPASLALSLDPQIRARDDVAVGLGWHLSPLDLRTMAWHNGMVGGSASFLGVVPEAGVAVVVLTNRQASVDALGVEVLRRLLAREE